MDDATSVDRNHNNIRLCLYDYRDRIGSSDTNIRQIITWDTMDHEPCGKCLCLLIFQDAERGGILCNQLFVWDGSPYVWDHWPTGQ